MQAGKEERLLVFQKDRWGDWSEYTQHVFVIDPETLTQKNILDQSLGLGITYEKNKDKEEAYISSKELGKLEGKILKNVIEERSRSRRKPDIVTAYYIVINGKLFPLYFEKNRKDARGFFDRVYLPNDRVLKIRKDTVEIEI